MPTAGRIEIPAATPWAASLAYSRAVAVDGSVFVSGTLPVDAQGHLVGGTDVYRQALHVLEIIAKALREAGATIADVVRLRIYLCDYHDLADIARAQAEVFGARRPACTVVKTELARAEFRVQMEADARVGRSIAGSKAGSSE
jgi:enamine deaminase RidA (YjgF/YER057c/UK114 family)